MMNNVCIILFLPQCWSWKNWSFYCSGPLDTTYKWPRFCGYIWISSWTEKWKNVHGTEPGKTAKLCLVSALQFLQGRILAAAVWLGMDLKLCLQSRYFFYIINPLEGRRFGEDIPRGAVTPQYCYGLLILACLYW